MSTKRFFILICSVLVITFSYFLTSCSEEVEVSNEQEYIEYVSAYTTGLISRHSNIQVRLVQKFHDDKEEVSDLSKYFKFEPKIEGETHWVNEQTIEFTPNEPLDPDQRYVVKFDIEKAINSTSKINPFIFEIRTIKRDFEIKIGQFEALSTKSNSLQRLTGIVETSDIENIDELKKAIFAEFENSETKVKWAPLPNKRQHQFYIDSLNRGDNEKKIKISWRGSEIGIDNSGEELAYLPPLNEFNVNKINVIHMPEQYISVIFTDPIKANQNLNGLITIQGITNLNFETSANQVKVYPPNRLYGDYTVNVNEGIRNSLNFRMKSNFRKDITFENLKPAVKLVGNGVIMPDNKHGLVLPFEAVNLKSVDVIVTKIFENNMSQFLQLNNLDGQRELKRVGKHVLRKVIHLDKSGIESLHKWNRFTLDLNEIAKEEIGVIYRVRIGFRKQQSLYACGEINADAEESQMTEMYQEENVSSYWDYYENYYYSGYNWRDRDNPCTNSYYGSKKSVSKNIIHSNIGIIAKRGSDNSMFFATTNIATGKPMANVSLKLLNYQKQELVKLLTNGEGIAETKLKDKVFLILAEKDKEKGYLKMDDGSSLSLSKFNVGGSQVKKGLKGFIYGDRGVWRPGDSVFVTFVLEDLEKNIPENHPIIFELRNPKQQIAEKIVKQRSKSDFYTFKFKTDDDAYTGTWNSTISIGGIKFYKKLKIETVKPNRLKIKFDIKEQYFVKNQKEKIKLAINWLHGAPAKNIKAKIDATFTKSKTSFNRYSDYSFDDITNQFDSDPKTIFEGNVNAKGEAIIDTEFNLNQSSPGKLKINFLTKAFEPGGDFSLDKLSFDFHPYKSYVGIRLPKGDKRRGMLLTDKKHKVDIVALDIDGKPVKNRKVEVKLHKASWRWWWDQSNNQANYSHNIYEELIMSDTILVKNGEGSWNIEVKYPSWGRYIVTATDLKSKHKSTQFTYIDWPGWAGRAQRENPGEAAMLTFSTKKEKYEVGEEIELSIPSSESARSLISIENGTKVIDSYWVNMNKGENKFTFIATEEMTPNIYANITLIQPHSRTENDLPIRLYGIMPIYIENKRTHLFPSIKMPDVLKPEESFTLNVSEKNNKKMTYTIAVVDEGLLDLTRFNTPDPWNYFYSKEALGVRSWDIFDMVIGAYGSKLENHLAVGGGEFERPKNGTKVNRFKPMVRFYGPFTINGNSKNHKVDVPNYVGSVRTMIIAGNNGAYGSIEKTTPVRKPLMVIGTLPRLLGPSETVQLPVSVFAMEEKVKNVSVSIKPNNLFEVIGDKTKQLTFEEVGDRLINFELKVNPVTGIGKVEIEAISSLEKATYQIELEVRNPNPLVVDVEGKVIKADGAWENTISPFGSKGTNKCLLEVSSIPPMNLGKRLDYLIRYPHGCIEQTTSAAFPQLYLTNLLKLTDSQKARVEENIKRAIRRLSTFQIQSGALSYWPGSSKVTEWGTTYAGHFLIEAQNNGFSIPGGILTKWKKYQKRIARNWAQRANRSGLSQAYRLYTLALLGESELGAMNRLRSYKGLEKQSKFRLAAAYQLAGKPEVAQKIIANLGFEIDDYTELGNTFGSALRDKAMILESVDLINNKEEAFLLVKSISEQLNKQKWHSTQTLAYSLLAVGKFVKNNKINEKVNFEYSLDGGDIKKITSFSPVIQEEIDISLNDRELKINNLLQTPIYVQLITQGKPITSKSSDNSNKLNIDVGYFLLDGTLLDPTTIEQGTDFIAEVTVKHPYKNHIKYEQMELHQIFPSGWEIVNTRMLELESFVDGSTPEYQDIRDDRVYTFYDLNANQKKTFRVLLNASYLGEYYLPPVYSQAMYDNRINASKKGHWVRVVLPEDIKK